MVLDLAKPDEIPAKVEKILKIVNVIDILINNAGVSYRGEVLTTKIQVDQDVMLVNYIAQVALIKGKHFQQILTGKIAWQFTSICNNYV